MDSREERGCAHISLFASVSTSGRVGSWCASPSSRTRQLSRQLLADYLARYSDENGVSFDVTYFEDGGAIIGDYKPVYDIILMDIQMTNVDGMTAARAIREVDQEVVLVFITSAAQFAIHGYQVGALSYLMKPLPWFAFSQELSRCLRGRCQAARRLGPPAVGHVDAPHRRR